MSTILFHPGVLVSLASAGWWVGNIVSGEISPFLLSSSLGTAGTLLLHAVICALIFVFILLLLPETKVRHIVSYRYVHLIGQIYASVL